MPSPPWKPGKPATLIPLGNIDLATRLQEAGAKVDLK